MSERIAHDHPTIETIPVTLGRVGGTTRPEVRIEHDLGVDDGDIIHVVLDGSEYRSMVEQRDATAQTNGVSTVIRGAYDTPRLAREPGSSTNHLVEWVEARDLEFGRTLHLDVVEEGFKYGLRGPGERATYTTGRPDSSLSDIAESLGRE